MLIRLIFVSRCQKCCIMTLVTSSPNEIRIDFNFVNAAAHGTGLRLSISCDPKHFRKTNCTFSSPVSCVNRNRFWGLGCSFRIIQFSPFAIFAIMAKRGRCDRRLLQKNEISQSNISRILHHNGTDRVSFFCDNAKT